MDLATEYRDSNSRRRYLTQARRSVNVAPHPAHASRARLTARNQSTHDSGKPVFLGSGVTSKSVGAYNAARDGTYCEFPEHQWMAALPDFPRPAAIATRAMLDTTHTSWRFIYRVRQDRRRSAATARWVVRRFDGLGPF